MQQLAYEDLPVDLPQDELFAVVAYTYDTQSGQQRGQLYFELNAALRTRSAAARASVLSLWGGYLYYLLAALGKLRDVTGVFYRGYPDKQTVQDKYKVGRPIQWGAFSSTSQDLSVTKQFTNKQPPPLVETRGLRACPVPRLG